MELRLTNPRQGPFGTVIGFADIVMDDVLVIRGAALKQKNDGSDYYVQFPATKRIDRKTGETVQKNGYDVYDNHVDLYLEEKDGKWSPTKAAFEIRKEIIALLVAEFIEGGASSPRAQAARGATSTGRVPAKAAAKTASRKTDDAVDTDGEDDDLPF